MAFTEAQLTGFDDSALVALPESLATKPKQLAHPATIEPLLSLADAARKAGVPFKVLSSYRSFEQQLLIWNDKVAGNRPIITAENQLLDPNRCPTDELIKRIMYFSALPGGSRHHWGTEFDIFPEAALTTDYQVQLVQEEFAANGIAEALGHWLTKNLPLHGFFRPYERYQQGVAAEPWHLSYQPLAAIALAQLDLALLTHCIEQQSELALQAEIIEQLPSLYQGYIVNICEYHLD